MQMCGDGGGDGGLGRLCFGEVQFVCFGEVQFRHARTHAHTHTHTQTHTHTKLWILINLMPLLPIAFFKARTEILNI